MSNIVLKEGTRKSFLSPISTLSSFILLVMKEARIIHGRLITPAEVMQIRDLIEGHADWSRRRLSIEVSTQWSWRNAKGELRDMACRTVLLRLHRAGIIELPSPRRKGQNHWRQEPVRDIKLDTSPLDAGLSSLTPLKTSLVVSGSAESRLFRYLLQEYHYGSSTEDPLYLALQAVEN